MEAGKVICDTDVVIEFFERARDRHRQTFGLISQIGEDNIVVSIVTKMELIKGIKNREHERQVTKNLKRLSVLPLGHRIGTRAESLLKTYHLSHGLAILDALIAATSIETGFPLFSYNAKDFRFIKGLRLFPS